MPPRPSKEAEASTRIGRVLTWLSDNVAVVLTLSGILLYGGSRIALDAFYQPLGTTSSEAGVSYLEIVAVAGISIAENALTYIILAAIIVLFMYGLTLVFTRILKWFRRGTFTYLDYLEEIQSEYKPLRTMAGLGIMIILLQIFNDWYLSLPPRPPRWAELSFTLFLLVVAPIALPMAFAIGTTRKAGTAPSPPSDFVTDMFGMLRGDTIKLFVALLPLILIGTTIQGATEQGAQYAVAVKRGEEIQPAEGTAIPFRASCVTLLPIGGQTSAAFDEFKGHKLLYLGQSGGVSVLHQVGVGTVRVPSGSFALRRASAPCQD